MPSSTYDLSPTVLKDIIEWDITNWSVSLQYWKEHTSKDLSSSTALELGSRHGGLSLWLALNGAKVLCTDLHGPTNLAVEKHKKYNVASLISYQAVDALDIPYRGYFDIVAFKSVLGEIGHNSKESQMNAVRQIHACLRDTGELLFAENLVASPVHRYLRNRYVEWAKIWRWVTIPEMLEFLSIFSQVRYMTLGFLGALGRNEWQRNVLGAIDRKLDPVVPERWRYLMIGIARK